MLAPTETYNSSKTKLFPSISPTRGKNADMEELGINSIQKDKIMKFRQIYKKNDTKSYFKIPEIPPDKLDIELEYYDKNNIMTSKPFDRHIDWFNELPPKGVHEVIEAPTT